MLQSVYRPPRASIHLILIALALLATISAWRSLIYYADAWPFNIDEITFTQGAVNFFRSANYTSDFYSGDFPAGMSNGLAATWPSAIAWSLQSNLFTSRLILGASVWLFFLLAGGLFWRRQSFPLSLKIFLLAGAWSLILFAIPNAMLLMMNTGELVGALWIGLGILLLRRGSPYAAAFSWGIAIWLCKFVYIPVVIAVGGAWLITSPEPWSTRLRRLGLCFLIFITPLLLWLSIIWLRFGSATVSAWLQGIQGWMGWSVTNWTGSAIVAPAQTTSPQDLFARLTSPALEWQGYATDWKIKILILSVGSVALSFALLKSRLASDRQSRWFVFAVTACVSAYTLWYFFLHPTMFIRHFQPALYLGLGLCLFWVWRYAQRWAPSIKRRPWLWLGFAGVLIGAQTIEAWQLPLQHDVPTFARTCVDLFSPNCGDYTALSHRIRQTPGAVVVRNGPAPTRYAVFDDSYRPIDYTVPATCPDPDQNTLAQQLEAITRAHSEIWLLRTMPLKCDENAFVPGWLDVHAYPAEEFWLENNLFTRYIVASGFVAQGTQAGQLGDSISLASWGIDKVNVAPGQALNVELTWVSKDKLPLDYRVIVFLASPSEQVIVQRDAMPVMWLRPTTSWQPGESIVDHHALLIPPDAASGEYWLSVGLYDPVTGERLPVIEGEGWLNDTVLRLTSVIIANP